MPIFHRFPHQLHTALLFPGKSAVIFIDQSGIAADLAQAGQLRQNLKLSGFYLIPALFDQSASHLFHMGTVNGLLLFFHLHINVFFQFIRQLFQYILFHAPQDEGSNHFLETFGTRVILLIGNGNLIRFLKCLITSQDTRHQIIKNS